ncbi:hypothetical protein GCK72_017245 [Caenorhabditis remanei]|uniref:DNA-directed DNA polymerase n=1 Tax=Caenorhabditis remanei TaxID=31234 RepID=A0A6A5G800_CAERE|nr:hypothetical protein GCK72_017244 [Caenorhabditis remanei]XP_053580887.1 hypothetical protein GCK72_017245 [Caenorhabditis remanei]KAF1750693.1 hypothetical protein GCK72_017244 [Caenorhabditis remanei]KAF1750694.1 hypothetical protein GCK72_017245 [Caenorhabditis remanei]
MHNSSTTEGFIFEEQVGGARVRLISKNVKKAEGRFRGIVELVTLSIELPTTMTSHPQAAELFSETLVELAKRHDPFKTTNTMVGIGIDSEENPTSIIGIPLREIRKVTTEEIVTNLSRISQSNKSPLELDIPKLVVTFTYVNPQTGTGKRKFDTGSILELTAFEKRQKLEELDKELFNDSEMNKTKQTRSNIMPNEVLDDCLPHALYQAQMYYEWKHCQSLENLRRYRDSIRKTYKRPGICTHVYETVQKMKERAGMTKCSNFDRLDIEQFQKTVFAGQYQITCFVKTSKVPYYVGPYLGPGKQLVLYLSDGHYSGVRSVCALLKTSCPLIHRLCGKSNCPKTKKGEEIRCESCTVLFHSQECYDNHRKKGPNGGKSRCDYTKACKKCNGIYYTNKNKDAHKCGEKWCYRCNCKRTKKHDCFMPKSIKNEKKLTRQRVYFDIESRADEKTGQQHPVLFVALRCCPNCSTVIPKDVSITKKEICEKCAPDGRLKIIECISQRNRDVNVAQELTKWLFADHHRGRVVVAHNASGYDAQFILEQMISSNKATPKLILEGTKLIFMEHNGVRLLDSMKFLTMSLAAMGKAFEIDSVKEDFPVLFIKPDHYDYDADIPDEKWYDLNNKTSSVKKQILSFLESQKNVPQKFNFYNEIVKYCYNDVYILSKAMNIFETEFEQMTNVCLLEESTTAASAAAVVFRRNHLDPTKPIVLDEKPSVSKTSSVVSQKYLAWFSQKEGVQVNMSTTYGEEKIGKYRVDGFVPPCEKYPKGLVIEFQGCYWHAHDCTYAEESVISGESARDIRARDEARFEDLKQIHPVKIVWECEVNQELLKDSEMAKFFEEYEPVGILHCEKSLVGGRTEVYRLHANNVRQFLRYLDVVSLYPTVMKHEAFPIGSPENVQRKDMKSVMTKPDDIPFRGFLSCRVLPPKNLKLPILPMKLSGKLLFCLCKKCAVEMCNQECKHSDEERSFNGTFTTIELQKALSLGYIITNIYHGLKYSHWVQNDEKGEGGLFTSYINQMMEEKIYSSGWPSNVKTDEEKDAFCKAYLEKEHIHLTDRRRFKKNPGKRAVAKLMLNSLWGKFAQNVDRETTTIITDPCEFWNLVYDTSVVISIVRCVNDVLVVKHRKQQETLQSLKTSAMQLASYTTSYARLRLYRFMEMVGGENIIYTDTDSIIYAVPEGTKDPLEMEVGPYLGQLTDELSGEMTEFVSLGPKTYCYRDLMKNNEEKIVRKAKGITMSSQVEKYVNFEMMRAMVDEAINNTGERTEHLLPQHTIRRDNSHKMYSKNTEKVFKYTFNKRRLLGNGTTLPFGYCQL